jgi:hypothetical protein
MQNFESNNEKEAFLLAWTASIWKRIWRCMYLYCNHKNIPVSTAILLKCLKYNLLCPTGIVSQLIPQLEKAFKQGFLMPKEYENNEYVKRAIRLFGEAYRIANITDLEKREKEESDFIHNFSSTICTDKEEYIKKEEVEIISFPHFEISPNTQTHSCSFCELVDAWDIEITLYTPPTPLHASLFQTIFHAFIF